MHIPDRLLNVGGLLLLLLGLAACGAPPNLTPAPTITPLPTATPDVSNAGQPNNPLRMALRPADLELARLLEATFEKAVLNASAVTIDLVLVENDAEALAAVCETGSDQLTVAWLNGLGYLAANEQNCGDAVLRIERDRRPGEAGVIIVNNAVGSSLLNLRNTTFCRLSYDDFYSWLLPTLLFRVNNLSVTDFERIEDRQTTSQLVTAVSTNQCAGAGLPESAYDALINRGDPRLAEVRLATTSVAWPFGVLVYPNEIPLAARISLTDGLLTLATALDPSSVQFPSATPDASPAPTPVAAEATADADTTPQPTARPRASATPFSVDLPESILAPFFGEGARIVRADPADFRELEVFIGQTRLDFEELGN